MRSTSIALSSLAMLLAWKAAPVHASGNPPLPTPLPDAETKTAIPQASPQPVTIAAPESIATIESATELPTAKAELDSSGSESQDAQTTLETPTLKAESPNVEISIVPSLSTPKLTAQVPINPDPTASPVDRAPTDTEPQALDPQDTQSERGEIEIIEQPAQQPAQRRQPDVQLLLRSSVFSSSNITGLEALKLSDTVFVNSAQLLATPKLGENTRLIASAGGGLVRFATEGNFNYNFLTFNVALQQRLAPGTFGQLGWVQDSLYRSDGGDRLVRDNAIQFILGRQDQLGRNLRLDSFYELRAGFANPDDQSRVTNTLGTRLRYDITPTVQGALDYRLTFKNFTQVDRSDTEHQLGASVIYNISPDVFVAGTVSYLFGRSSESAVNLSNLSFGLNLGFNVPLF
jgi:hypothetical protein